MSQKIAGIPDNLSNFLETEKISATELDHRKLIVSIYLRLLDDLPSAKTYYTMVKNALDRILNFDIGFAAAITELEYNIETLSKPPYNDLISIENKEWMDTIRQKITKLMFLESIILASGLLVERDAIMAAYVNTIFPTTSSKTSSNVNNIPKQSFDHVIQENVNKIIRTEPIEAAPKTRKKV